jgi:hypothetical protein
MPSHSKSLIRHWSERPGRGGFVGSLLRPVGRSADPDRDRPGCGTPSRRRTTLTDSITVGPRASTFAVQERQAREARHDRGCCPPRHHADIEAPWPDHLAKQQWLPPPQPHSDHDARRQTDGPATERRARRSSGRGVSGSRRSRALSNQWHSPAHSRTASPRLAYPSQNLPSQNLRDQSVGGRDPGPSRSADDCPCNEPRKCLFHGHFTLLLPGLASICLPRWRRRARSGLS